jgi:ribosome-associated translation inhibitor RaiA
MDIHVHTDHNIDGREALATWVTGVIEQSLGGVSRRISRVEVHLTDENSDKKTRADDMRCVLEVKIDGRPPLVVTEQADTIHNAVIAGSDQLARLVDHTLERVSDRGAAETHRW